MTITFRPRGWRITTLVLTPEKEARAKYLLTTPSRLGRPRSLQAVATQSGLSRKQVEAIRDELHKLGEGEAMSCAPKKQHTTKEKHDALTHVLMVIGKCTDSFNEVERQYARLGADKHDPRYRRAIDFKPVHVPASEKH